MTHLEKIIKSCTIFHNFFEAISNTSPEITLTKINFGKGVLAHLIIFW